jgi:tetratricopeptide (TPR) repeat protein
VTFLEDAGEKLTIEGSYYRDVTGELGKAAQALETVVKSYPRLPEFESMVISPHVELGIVYMNQGRYEDAAEVTRESLRYVPHHIPPYIVLAQNLIALQRFDEARAILQKVPTRMNMGMHMEIIHMNDLHVNLYALAFVSADERALAREEQWFESKPESEKFGFSLTSDTKAYAGQLGTARDFTKRSVDSAIRENDKKAAALWLENSALREAAFGNVEEAMQAAAKGLKLLPASEEVELEADLAYAMAGDSARADAMAAELNKARPLNTQLQSLWLPATRGQVALNHEQAPTAIDRLQPVRPPIEYGLIDFVLNTSCLYPTYIHGEAFLAAGQGKEAAAEFQKILDRSGIVWNCWTGALAHLGVARANALQSRTSQGADADAARVRALAAYKDFLTLWKDADIHILKQAKAEYAKLQ